MDSERIAYPRCIRCERKIRGAVRASLEEDPREVAWEMPSGAVVLDGGNNFGSTLIDRLIDGVGIQVVICDGCIKALDHRRSMIRFVKNGLTIAERCNEEGG